MTTWLGLHLPMAGAIAATGAAMVGLIEHATDSRTPAATAWLIGAGVAIQLTCLAVIMTTLDHDERDLPLVRPAITAIMVGALASLALAALRPSPWLLALALTGVLSAVWGYAFALRARPASTPRTTT